MTSMKYFIHVYSRSMVNSWIPRLHLFLRHGFLGKPAASTYSCDMTFGGWGGRWVANLFIFLCDVAAPAARLPGYPSAARLPGYLSVTYTCCTTSWISPCSTTSLISLCSTTSWISLRHLHLQHDFKGISLQHDFLDISQLPTPATWLPGYLWVTSILPQHDFLVISQLPLYICNMTSWLSLSYLYTPATWLPGHLSLPTTATWLS